MQNMIFQELCHCLSYELILISVYKNNILQFLLIIIMIWIHIYLFLSLLRNINYD